MSGEIHHNLGISQYYRETQPDAPVGFELQISLFENDTLPRGHHHNQIHRMIKSKKDILDSREINEPLHRKTNNLHS